MPNRIVRDAILTSEAVCSLAWPEEVFYRRLMSIADDYGRHEANPQLLRSRCYPLQTDLVRVADITRWMAACQKSGVILVYEVAGKQYLEIAKFGQQQRSASKCPAPTSSDSKCAQTTANAHLDVFVFEDVSVSEGVVGGAAQDAAPTPPPPFDGTNSEILNGKAVVCIAASFELPEEWGVDAEALGWKPAEVLREAEKFRQYWTAGRGKGTRRAVKGWRQTWSNWLEKAAKDAR